MLDLVIIGGGPAALSAALYAARAGLSVTVFEQQEFGGVLPKISHLENYPGFSGEGSALAQQMRQQAASAGAILEYGECTSLARDDNGFLLTIDGENIEARCVLVASGTVARRLDFTPSAPVSYCALCDGPLVEGKHIAVIGGANSAVQESLHLAAIAKDVTLMTHSTFKADQELLKRLRRLPNVKTLEHTEPTPDNLAEYDHIFVYIGKIPATSFVDPKLLDPQGHIVTDTSSNLPHQTVTPGLFAAGDVRHGAVKQVITAAADGAAAAIEIAEYCQKML